ncbi:NADP-dependent oxidoreductase [Mucilaginibacter jinjuensis]|uniref:NADP-dependent oxidoreductase n=1 Tax=Mucilaginibacter jinjuensis TaxID=1176721 RepID=A0ABY7T848_9SPHI|nr:NADP-dependent oxidoreductase [Mucilaginibacter jinjuensis]WCT12414.1 NADP-dependent oxidoreductase [Mucilaginibacter jinjuensis]
MKNKTIKLKNRPVGMPLISDFVTVEEPMPLVGIGEILLKAVYISVDPYLRGKMSGTKEPRFEINEPITSKLIAEVVESKNGKFKKGEFVSGYLDWKEYQVNDGTGVQQVNAKDAPLSAYLGVLGITGLSAYFALLDIGKPKRGETLVISGAAGAVGSIAGQIGKIMGCYVVGIVGTDEKAELLTTKFGFDAAINYKTTPDIRQAIAASCPNGVDIYFDNIGGEISDAVIANMNPYGRIPLCGSISNYNDTEQQKSPSLLPIVVYKFLTVQGFLIANFAERFPEAVAQLTRWLNEGKLTYSETIVDGFTNLPQAFIGLFEGKNTGKMLVRI